MNITKSPASIISSLIFSSQSACQTIIFFQLKFPFQFTDHRPSRWKIYHTNFHAKDEKVPSFDFKHYLNTNDFVAAKESHNFHNAFSFFFLSRSYRQRHADGNWTFTWLHYFFWFYKCMHHKPEIICIHSPVYQSLLKNQKNQEIKEIKKL